MVVPAAIEQSRPIFTSAPITVFAPITLPLPISTHGPITAPGSMATPSSIRALASTWAPAKSPGSDSEDGRNACGNNLRAAITKARYGSRTVSTATRAGSSLASAAVVRQAPACVVAAADAKLLLSKNVRSQGAARSSGAILTMRRAFGGFDANVAPVKVAISSRERPGERRKKSGSLILLESDPSYSQLLSRSEPGAATEPEILRAIAHLRGATRCRRAIFFQRISQIETQRPKWRIPQQA